MNIPIKLYKYQVVNSYSLSNLKSNKLYFGSASQFNDPYDCFHDIDFEDLSETSVMSIFKSVISSRLSELLTKLLDNSITPEELEEIIRLISQQLQNSVTIDKNEIQESLYLKVENEIKNDQLFEVHKESAKRSIMTIANRQVQTLFSKLHQGYAENVGISCFSETPNDMLMWSYYGDGHRGFCLEFDTRFDPFSGAKKVKYVENVPRFNPDEFFSEENGKSDYVEILLATKYIGWNHEKEWRVFHQETSKLYGYQSKSLTGIYLGANIDSTIKEILLTLLKSQNHFVNFYQMVKVPGSFKITPEPITYQTHLEAFNFLFKKLQSEFSNKEFGLSDILSLKIAGLSKDLIQVLLQDMIYLKKISATSDQLYILNINTNDNSARYNT